MNETSGTNDRANHGAIHDNANLPEAYQNLLLDEELRVTRDVLGPRRMKRRRILLVGGAGYIGSVLIEHLLARGYEVRCLDLLLYHNRCCVEPFLCDPDFEFIDGDYVDGVIMDAALENVTDVVLLAGLVGDPITKKYSEASEAINQIGYENLIAKLSGRGLNKVIFISTCSNYGLMESAQPATEESDLNPLSAYARAKVDIEKRLLALNRNVDFVPAILRFATAFGLSPRMRFDLTVSQFTREIALDNGLLVYDPETWRPYCHVQDFSEVIRRVLEAPRDRVAFEIFNAGGDENNYTKRMIVEAILTQIPDRTVDYLEKGSDPRNYRVDFAKIRNTLYFEPKHSVVDGIRELLSALNDGRYGNIEAPAGFFGNYEISYP
jgi:nucleoside-diphosphate-sugar epimerase